LKTSTNLGSKYGLVQLIEKQDAIYFSGKWCVGVLV